MSTWYEDAVFYHMYPLGMTGVPTENPFPADFQENASSRPDCLEECKSGTAFSELNAWIPYIKDLNISALYIGPLFESSTHGYDTRDLRRIDRRLGTSEDFRAFVSHCHAAGIRVIVDAVFNHTGRDFFAFQDVRKNLDASPYCSWYRGIHFGWSSPMGDPFGYEAWHGIWDLPCLNHDNPQVRDYILDTVRFWIHEFDIDGLRLDCAGDLSFLLMEELRKFSNSLKKDFWLMGEVIHGDYSRFVRPQMLHSVTNYEMHKSIYSAHNDHNYFELAHNVRRLEKVGRQLYTFVDNHDENRIASKLNSQSHLAPVYTLLFTLPGIPSIYYGSEWGIQGLRGPSSDTALRPRIRPEELPYRSELFQAADKLPQLEERSSSGKNRMPQEEHTDDGKKNLELYHLIRRLAEIHRSEPALHSGLYQELFLTNRQYAFARIDSYSAVLAAANNDDAPASFSVSLPFHTNETELCDLLTGRPFIVQNNQAQIELEGNSAVILKITEG